MEEASFSWLSTMNLYTAPSGRLCQPQLTSLSGQVQATSEAQAATGSSAEPATALLANQSAGRTCLGDQGRLGLRLRVDVVPQVGHHLDEALLGLLVQVGHRNPRRQQRVLRVICGQRPFSSQPLCAAQRCAPPLLAPAHQPVPAARGAGGIAAPRSRLASAAPSAGPIFSDRHSPQRRTAVCASVALAAARTGGHVRSCLGREIIQLLRGHVRVHPGADLRQRQRRCQRCQRRWAEGRWAVMARTFCATRTGCTLT